VGKSLVVVESPTKARTINKYLGKDFLVKASLGHIKDLPKSKLGVDVAKGFEPTITVLPGKKKVLDELKKAAQGVDKIYLATDPDREGEAISAHLAEELGGRGKKLFRVLLEEITKRGVLRAFENPGKVDQDKVDAQMARRILDRLMGYKISPLLWDKVRRGLSAGRVQSVALRMICEREAERAAFVTHEYWSIDASLEADVPPPFVARLHQIDGKKVSVPTEGKAATVSTKDEAGRIVAEAQKAEFRVAAVEAKEKKRHPVPPFITSKLQQDAARRLGFSVKKTMMLAQRLYEGKDLGEAGTVGLITYMRTDSARIAPEAIASVREHIEAVYGKDYLPDEPRIYRSRKAAQEAHEAIRPTSLDLPPDRVKAHLAKDELQLYTLIWSRFVASQMASAIFDTTTADISAGRCTFRASGSVTKFAGFLAAYQDRPERVDGDPVETDTADGERPEAAEGEEAAEVATGEGMLPPLARGQVLRLQKVDPQQHFTQPPPRYGEASLVKALEENGIGRPSTYASIIATLTNREYVEKLKGRFVPSELGKLVTELLVKSFGDLINVDYTARMEEELDEIEEGKLAWVKALGEFNTKFQQDLKRAQVEMRNVKTEEVKTDQTCAKCGKPMVIKWGRYGKFMACSGYPECKNTIDLADNGGPATAAAAAAAPAVDEKCEKCGKDMVMRKGRFGQFIACSGYPDCRNTRKLRIDETGSVTAVKDQILDEKCPRCSHPLALKQGRFGAYTACSDYPTCRYIKLKETGVACPNADGGQIVERKSRRGKVFYGCDKYPECDFVLWYHPVARPCPNCDAKVLVEKTTKRDGHVVFCADKECGWEETAEGEAAAPRGARSAGGDKGTAGGGKAGGTGAKPTPAKPAVATAKASAKASAGRTRK
jgi:DNA topoisomerase-1